MNRSHIGRPPSQLVAGDVAITHDAPGITGMVVFINGVPHVKWSDRPDPMNVAKSGVVITMRRPGEVLWWEELIFTPAEVAAFLRDADLERSSQ